MSDMDARDRTTGDSGGEVMREGNTLYRYTPLEGNHFPPKPFVMEIFDAYGSI